MQFTFSLFLCVLRPKYVLPQLIGLIVRAAVDVGGVEVAGDLVHLVPGAEAAVPRGRRARPHELHAADLVLRVEVVVGRDLDGATVGVPLRLRQEGAAVLGAALLVSNGDCDSLLQII